jgi:exosortase/archaeosortase family protein
MQRHSLVSHAPHRGLNPERHDAIALVERVFLIISVVPIAILANAARVTGTGILAHTVGPRIAHSVASSPNVSRMPTVLCSCISPCW